MMFFKIYPKITVNELKFTQTPTFKSNVSPERAMEHLILK